MMIFLSLPRMSRGESENNNLCCRLGTPFASYFLRLHLRGLKGNRAGEGACFKAQKHDGDGIIIIIYFYCRLQHYSSSLIIDFMSHLAAAFVVGV
jgi:hypothetical protein